MKFLFSITRYLSKDGRIRGHFISSGSTHDMQNHRFGWKSDILYIWVIKVICKNTNYFFLPLRGPTGATKLRDFDIFALDKDTLNGCNFFVFEDNWKIQIAGERYWLGQKKYFCYFRVSQIFFSKNSKLRLKLQK